MGLKDWPAFAILAILATLVLVSHGSNRASSPIYSELPALRSQVKAMFMHGFNSYMNHAYPLDELMPVTCGGRTRPADGSTPRGTVDLVLGRYQVTLVDAIDTLYVMGEKELWKKYLDLVIETVRFDSDLTVSVFETNIRALGSLVTNYLFCVEEGLEQEAQALLNMAADVGDRLLPAFATPTGMPVSVINLKTGSSIGQVRDTCAACAGTYILEFGMLSKLTGNPIYYETAMRALEGLDLISSRATVMPQSVDVDNGNLMHAISGIGAGTDSLYEYLIKAYILFGDDYFFSFFADIYTRAMSATLIEDWYIQANIQSSQVAAAWTDSLGAFWPGMQVLAGDLRHAQSGFARFWSIWKRWGVGLPERYDVGTHQPIIAHYPLRPELIESAYMLYGATQDPYYLHVGKEIMHSLENHTKVPCGYAALKHVARKDHEDSMESFFLSETLKYLYLLFTPDHDINKGNYVFTTEGHPIPVHQNWKKSEARAAAELHPTGCVAPAECRPDFLSSRCMSPNSLYTKEARKFGVMPFQLHYVMDGIIHADVKHIGAHVLPSDREVIVTVVADGQSTESFYAIRATFGAQVLQTQLPKGIAIAEPPDACTPLSNPEHIRGKVAIAVRGGCTFAEKAAVIEQAGAVGGIFINNMNSPVFPMSDDKWNPSTVNLPLVLVSREDGQVLKELIDSSQAMLLPEPVVSLSPAHPQNELGVLQFVLELQPNVPSERWPPLNNLSADRAFKYGDAFVLMSSDPQDHKFRKEWEGSNFQVFINNNTAPFRITRAMS